MKAFIHEKLSHSIDTLTAVLADAQIQETLIQVSEVTADSLRAGGKLLVAGNGGSAADAQHLVAEFVGRLTVTRPALRAVALTTDSSILTAVSNDFGYEHIFERQVEALGQKGDVLMAISTSGNFPNLLCALRQARQQGLTTFALTGAGGGQMTGEADYHIAVPSKLTTAIQESHLALEHFYCALVERFTFGMDFDQ